VRVRLDDLDRLFVFALLGLLVFGLVVIYSACHVDDGGVAAGLWKKQMIFAVLGLAAFVGAASLPPALWERLSWVLYPAGLVGLILVFFIGSSAGGATRWISLAGIRFQPAELAKLATVLMTAKVLSGRRRPPDSAASLIVPSLLLLIPAALVLRQPDLGTALVFLSMGPAMLYWAGVPFPFLLLAFSPAISVVCASSLPSWIVFSVGLFALAYFTRALLLEKILFVTLSVVMGIATPVLWGRLEPYQQSRILAFLDPGKYSSGAGYQLIQSKVAIGSGGLTGVGYLEGTQKGLAFLPARHTDFVFSVVGEEFGFVGTMALVGLFTLLLIRGCSIAASARDPFAGLTVVGLLSMLGFQVFVNIGVTLGLVPVTGLPLPVFSYGGTSLIATLTGLGIVTGVNLRRRS
jgi:rod shape determining protein RodA